jgi:hypothetical protein
VVGALGGMLADWILVTSRARTGLGKLLMPILSPGVQLMSDWPFAESIYCCSKHGYWRFD